MLQCWTYCRAADSIWELRQAIGLRSSRTSRFHAASVVRGWTRRLRFFSGRGSTPRSVSAGGISNSPTFPVTPKPLQLGGPPLWVGGESRAAIRRAARLGCHLLPSPSKEFDVIETYRSALIEYGRDPLQYRIKSFGSMFCANKPQMMWPELRAHILYQHNLYRQWYRAAGASEAPDIRDADNLPRDSYIVGTPDQCENAIRSLQRQLSAEEFIFWAYPPGFSTRESTSSLELFAREVIPRFR
jgi:alkanesulfonate monooxygenase SsuD/methylene tetrahydromethanopterin reductase-like flavin-dependent oxidoreductase (luciferase family)